MHKCSTCKNYVDHTAAVVKGKGGLILVYCPSCAAKHAERKASGE